MKHKAPLLILLILITMLFNIQNVSATKQAEYKCVYTKKVEENKPSTPALSQNIDKLEITIYSNTTSAEEETEIIATNTNANETYTYNSYIWNFGYEAKIELKGAILNLKTYYSENYLKWKKSTFKYSDFECPEYILYDYKDLSNDISTHTLASEELEKLKEFINDYGNAAAEKENSLMDGGILNNIFSMITGVKKEGKDVYFWGIFQKDDSTSVPINYNDSEDTCEDNENSNYDSICLYHDATSETVSLIGYAKDSEFMIKGSLSLSGETVSCDIKSDNPCYIGDSTINFEIAKWGKNYVTTYNSACPSMINEYLYTNYTSIYTEETITYTTNDSSKYGTVNNTYFLIEDGGYRDATTCEVKESENKLSTGSDVGNTCEDMFTDELINEIKKILKYIKILVPILIIVLGMVDFGRAMLASKEEEMKKAQSTFIKRLIIGVVIFLLPTIINSVLDLAQTAWKDDTLKNSNCIINELGK